MSLDQRMRDGFARSSFPMDSDEMEDLLGGVLAGARRRRQNRRAAQIALATLLVVAVAFLGPKALEALESVGETSPAVPGASPAVPGARPAVEGATHGVSRGPGVAGQVTGPFVAGSKLTIRVDATMSGGWQALHLVEVAIVSGNRVLDHLSFDIEDNKLTIGGQSTVVGMGGVATGTHLSVSGAEVVVTTGGANLTFEVRAQVVETIPPDVRFELRIVDDFGASDEVTRRPAEPESGGIT
jgi:hypothetical protein